MNKKTLTQKLKEKVERYALVGFAVSAIVAVGYSAGSQIYYRYAADKIADHQKTRVKGVCTDRTLYGFDKNHDGYIDRIIEDYACFGSKAAWPVRHNYSSGDSEFEKLRRDLGW